MIDQTPLQPVADPNAFEPNLVNSVEPIMAKPKPKIAGWLLWFFLAVFPPMAFYFLWVDKTRHGWFSALHFTFGISLVFFGFSYKFYILPQISSVISRFSAGAAIGGSLLVWSVLVLGILQTIAGLWVRKEFKNKGELSLIPLTVSTFLFVLDYVLPVAVYMQVITPLYNSILG